MKEKIIAAIKAKFPAINLSKKTLAEIATSVEKKVIDDETKIDATLDDFNSLFPLSELAKRDDAIRDLSNKLKAAQNPTKDKDDKTETTTVTEPVVIPDDVPEWQKQLIESNKLLAQQMQQLLSEKSKGTIRSKITDLLKDEKGELKVPESYWGKRVIPEKEEDLEAFVTEVQTDYTGFTKELTDKGISVVPGPRSGNQAAAGQNGKATKEEIDEVVKNIM